MKFIKGLIYVWYFKTLMLLPSNKLSLFYSSTFEDLLFTFPSLYTWNLCYIEIEIQFSLYMANQ